jgi:hypothetical protein
MKRGIGTLLLSLSLLGPASGASAEPMSVLAGSHFRLYLGGIDNYAGERGWGHVPVSYGGVEVSVVTLPLKVGAIVDVGISRTILFTAVTSLKIPAGLLSISNSSIPVGSGYAIANARNLAGTLGDIASTVYSPSTQSMLAGHVVAWPGFGGPIPLTGSIQFGDVLVNLGTDFSGDVNGLSWRTGYVSARVGFWDTAGGAYYWPEAESRVGSLKTYLSGDYPLPGEEAISITLVQPALFLANEVTQLNSFGELSLHPSPVPEPRGLLPIGLALIGLGGLWKRVVV